MMHELTHDTVQRRIEATCAVLNDLIADVTRTEKHAGTIEWRYRFTPEGTGTLVTKSYTVIRPVTRFGWFIIGVIYGNKDRGADLHRGMTQTLQRLATLAENPRTGPGASTADTPVDRSTT